MSKVIQRFKKGYILYLLNNTALLGRLARILLVHVFLIGCWIVLVDVIFELRDFETSLEDGFDKFPLIYILFAVSIGPIWEEIVFRLPFKRNKYMWVSIVLGLLLFLSLKLLLLKILAVAYIVFVCVFWIKENYILRYLTIGLSVMLFGLIHIGNYSTADIGQMTWMEIISSFFSQLILGAVLTFIRLKYSFKYGLIYHIAFNSILVSLGMISKSLTCS